MPTLVSHPDAVTPEWLSDVLGAEVVSAEGTRIGTGQIGMCVRFALSYAGAPGPASVVCKFGSPDPTSAAAGVTSGTYEREVAFYTELATTVDVARAACWYAAVAAGTADTVVVLEDLAPAEQGDQVAGASPADVELAVEQAARLHGPRWGDPALAEVAWMGPPFTVDAASWELLWMVFTGWHDLDPVTLAAGRAMIDTWGWESRLPDTVVHGDFRLDNLLFRAEPDVGPARCVTVADWQTVRRGPGLEDVAYLIGTSFADADVRRAHERDLVARYHRALTGYGVDLPFDDCWTEYRRHAFAGLAMAVVAGVTVGRTARGDAMFRAMATRSARMATDLDTAALLR